HQGSQQPGEVYVYSFSGYQTYNSFMAPDLLVGFAADRPWIAEKLVPALQKELGIVPEAGASLRRGMLVYAGSTLLILALLLLGVFFLVRDVSRETRTNRLRADFVSGVS